MWDMSVLSGVWGDMHELNLDWILKTMKQSATAVNNALENMKSYQESMNVKFSELEEIQKTQFGILKEDWNKQLEFLVSSIIPQLVRFTISTEGRLEAWIPSQWDDLDFYTEVDDMDSENFGKLQLKYDGMWKKL